MPKEVPETKICKHCGTQIPYAAKVCPLCRKRQRPSGCLIAVLVVVVLFVLLIVAAAGGLPERRIKCPDGTSVYEIIIKKIVLFVNPFKRTAVKRHKTKEAHGAEYTVRSFRFT